MAKPTGGARLLPANAKAVSKAVKSAGTSRRVVEYRIEGARGLVLHALPSGTATWYFHYDAEVGKTRKRRKLKLGRFDDVTLSEALTSAERLRPLIRQGADPVARKIQTRDALTFSDLATARLDGGDPLRPGTFYDYSLILKRDILPLIGTRIAKDVAREHVIEILDAISQRGAQRRADTARAVISSIYSFGIDRGLVEQNPALGLKNRHDYQPRDVVASAQDIRRLWLAMDAGEAAMSPPTANIVRLALLTGQRRTEISAVRRTELSTETDQPILVIPRGRAKNRNPHRVPLSPQAATLFREAARSAGDSNFVFPGERTGSHMGSRSVSKAMERAREKIGIEDITVHDLRRTAGSYMSQLGVPKDVRERVLNHGGKRSSSITDSVYNWYEYEDEKRAALELWADAVKSIVCDTGNQIEAYHLRLARLKGASTVRVA